MKRLFFAAVMAASSMNIWAGGLLTNTNQNIAFNRMMSREASIAIDGVYSNPAGVAFLNNGYHLSLNLQSAFQTRTIENEYAAFCLNANNQSSSRKFEGEATAPVIPSFQMAYNKGNWSYQIGFAVIGGGGKCEFKNGLGSFEHLIANTAVALPQVAGLLGMNEQFPQNSPYTFDAYMKGRQYYFGLQGGAAYKFNDNLAGYVGVRGVYADCSYYGYVKDIKVNKLPLSTLLGGNADIELNCDQTGFGVTPIIGIDYKLNKHWNFSARYEFKTRIRLKNQSVNKTPELDNMPKTLAGTITSELVKKGLDVNTATTMAVATVQNAAPALNKMKTTLEEGLGESLGEYQDGTKIAQDIPALLTLGVGYSPVDMLRINAGFHYFYDKQATSYGNKQELLDHGTVEWNAGVEADVCKKFTVSAGWQNTNYGTTDAYMDDKSFVTSSNSIGAGLCFHLNDKVDINAAYFTTLYQHHKTAEEDPTTHLAYKSDYTRTNNVIGVGVDVKF